MTNTSGRFAFLRQLVADGVMCMFGNPGTSEQNLLDALRDEEFKDFRYYLALHEGSAVAMADGYARALQRPALVQLHSYAGLANGLGMLYYARRGYTPLVVVAGEAGLRYDALDGQMAADLVTMARPFVKSDYNGPCAWRVLDSGSLLRLLRRAIKTAATPPTGPVFLALPMDLLDEENTETIERSLPVRSDVTPDRSVIEQAAQLLSRAERPLILMGDGIAASKAQAELTDVAEKLGAVVWGANCSEVNIAASHPLFCGYGGHMFGQTSRTYTSAADVILVCGTTVLPEVFPLLKDVFAKGAHVIHFDLNSYEIAKNFPVSLGALADPKPTLALLSRELDRLMSKGQRARAQERLDRQRKSKDLRELEELAKDATLRDNVPLRAPQFMQALAERLPKNALVFDEALTHSSELLRYLPQNEPGSYFQTRAGMLGTGFPGAIGLKAAYPDRMVFGFAGDGGGISTIQALATAARHGIGAKFVVCNNRSYRILKYNLREYWRMLDQSADQRFPEAFDLDKPNLRFDKIAEGQGVPAMRVERPDEIGRALDRAFQDLNEPFLIDLLLSSEL
ncbi:thiamine pyrophosphate-binding protein [Bradyrhizobium sp. 177]|uniref:thiamine pyrophosphate-binding protein n=1 Tax=Bradyrhizobium sp. 177 TaxID=2782647 RepID=UPI001FFBC790|nr:thiamine pyrophosphate-binding protein [Bradyrhizobium sp. 177]MCK1552314.1 thiamine pyrophosphate-binding protein [Bradyrhizobium sp. 177]